MLLILSPWHDPKPIKRCWCLFEIHNSLDEDGVEFDINIPRGEVEQLKAGVVEDKECVIQALSDIQAEKAQAAVESDKDMIFKVIEESPGGFFHVNQNVKKGLRSWYIEQLKLLSQQEPDNSVLHLHTANVMYEFGFHDESLQYSSDLLSKIPAEERENENSGMILNNMANVYGGKGETDKALEYYNKSLAVERNNLGESHPSMAASYNNMANVYHSVSERDKALEYFNKALTIQLNTRGEHHQGVATSYSNMVSVYSEKGELDKALEYCHKALTIQLNTVGDNHPDVAMSYSNMANVYSGKGELDNGLAYYNQSLTIRLKTFGKNHPSEVHPIITWLVLTVIKANSIKL